MTSSFCLLSFVFLLYKTNRYHDAAGRFSIRLIDHRKRHNVARTSVTDSAAHRLPLLCFYYILTSSVIHYWTDTRLTLIIQKPSEIPPLWQTATYTTTTVFRKFGNSVPSLLTLTGQTLYLQLGQLAINSEQLSESNLSQVDFYQSSVTSGFPLHWSDITMR